METGQILGIEPVNGKVFPTFHMAMDRYVSFVRVPANRNDFVRLRVINNGDRPISICAVSLNGRSIPLRDRRGRIRKSWVVNQRSSRILRLRLPENKTGDYDLQIEATGPVKQIIKLRLWETGCSEA